MRFFLLPAFRHALSALLVGGGLLAGPAGASAQQLQWAWMGGDTTPVENVGVYGTLGVAARENWPGPREGAAVWQGANGDAWVRGGNGADSRGQIGQLGDLWHYDSATGQWTWRHGRSVASTWSWPSYGTLGQPGPNVTPDYNEESAAWTDGSGNLWLFGGRDYAYRNTLWRYSPASGQWAWMGGSNTGDPAGVYGTRGTASTSNIPGARVRMGYCQDPSGNFWLYGGYGVDGAGASGYLNDLWKYSPATGQWTWVTGSSNVGQAGIYGPSCVFGATYTPGAREGAALWCDSDGKLWLFGGEGESGGTWRRHSDLWKFDPAIGQWSYISGGSGSYNPGVYGPAGVFSSSNRPAAASAPVHWTGPDGYLWMLAGGDLWKLDRATTWWAWVKGTQGTFGAGEYGTLGTAAAANRPGWRASGAGWVGAGGRLMMLGGDGIVSVGTDLLNDLWSFDRSSSQWTWAGGSPYIPYRPGIYGTRGVADNANRPAGREGFAAWGTTDSLWLFGGYGPDSRRLTGNLDDMWRYSTTTGQWTWMTGSSVVNAPTVAGAPGVEGDGYTPGNRSKAAYWAGADGCFWLFGGAAANDLWRFNPATTRWARMRESTTSALTVFGTRGVADPANTPGAREGAAACVDARGRVWMVGGYGRNGSGNLELLDELWMYDPATADWTWMAGRDTGIAQPVFGSWRTAGPVSRPGGRRNASCWVDEDGNFWMFGGRGYQPSGSYDLNDVWKYDPQTGFWTWMNGSQGLSYDAVYGPEGVFSETVTPGSSDGAAYWKTADGKFQIFGGANPYGNDLWSLDPATGNWALVRGACQDAGDVYGSPGVAAPGNHPGERHLSFGWARPNGSVWIFGGEEPNAVGSYDSQNDLWQLSDPAPQVTAITSLTASPTTGTQVQFRIDFSEPVSGFGETSDVLLLTEGGISAMSLSVDQTSSTRYLVTVGGISDEGALSVLVKAGAAADAAGQFNTTDTLSQPVERYNDLPPAVTSLAAITTIPANTPTLEWRVQWSEPVTGFTEASDITVVHTGDTTYTGVLVTAESPTRYRVALTGVNGSGQIQFRVNAGAAFDSVGQPNKVSALSAPLWRNYIGPPFCVISPVTESPTRRSDLEFEVNWVEPVNGFDSDDVTVEVSGSVHWSGMTFGPRTATKYRVSVGNVTGDGTVRLRVPAGTVTDAQGYPNPSDSISDAIEHIYAVGPVVERFEAVPVGAAYGSVATFTLKFSEEVYGLATYSFAYDSDGTLTTDVPPTLTTKDGISWTLRLTGLQGSGRLTIYLAPNAVESADGVRGQGAWVQATTYVHEGEDPRLPWQLACPAALVCGGDMLQQGSSTWRIAWGRALARGSIEILDPLFQLNPRSPGGTFSAGNKAVGVGIYPNWSYGGQLEKWARYQAGGTIYQGQSSRRTPLFPATINGVAVTDLFCQVMNGAFTSLTPANFVLQGYVMSNIQNGAGIFYDSPVGGVYPVGSGAFVQNSSAAVAAADALTSALPYQLWKERAILSGTYLRPRVGGGYVDHAGYQLQVTPYGALTTETVYAGTPLAGLDQITMADAIPPNLLTFRMGDRVLFVDTYEGTESGTRATVSIPNGSRFFWKGLLYLNANLDVAGGGPLPTVWGRDPDQQSQDPGWQNPYMGRAISNCFLDGVLYCTGNINSLGNGAIYGAVVTRGSVSATLPAIYYNSRLVTGLFRRGGQRCVSAASGPWYNPATWQNDQVPQPEGDDDVVIQEGHEIQVSSLYGPSIAAASLTNFGRLTVGDSRSLSIRGGFLSNAGTLELGAASQLRLEGYTHFHNSGLLTQGAGSVVRFGSAGTSGTITCLRGGTVDEAELVADSLQTGSLDPSLDGLSSTSLYAYVPALRIGKRLTVRNGGIVGDAVTYAPGGELVLGQGAHASPASAWPAGADRASGAPGRVTVEGWTRLGESPDDVYHAGTVEIAGGALLHQTSGTLVVEDGVNVAGRLMEAGVTTVTAGFGGVTVADSGVIETLRPVTGTVPVEMGLTGARMDVTAPGTLGRITVSRYGRSHPDAAPGVATGRYWEIDALTGPVGTQIPAAGYSVNLTLPRGGAADPWLCRYAGSAQAWTPARSSWTNDTVTLNGVTEFSTWAVGDAALGPVPVRISRLEVE